ncbi:MAG: low molecular weight protein arginine phosphatase [Clostridiaceae bacterium]|nr:low molecular weight protein arginine phosphatase [Clostridiaceae bacterium]
MSTGTDCAVLSEPMSEAQTVENNSPELILAFVCTGNTCRSPMAAALFEYLNARQPLPLPVRAESAGLMAAEGAPASANAKRALDEDYPGIRDLSEHRARGLNAELIERAGLLLTMESSHAEYLRYILPEYAHKIAGIYEYALDRSDGSVADPYGGDLEVYRATAREIHNLIVELLPRLRREINAASGK